MRHPASSEPWLPRWWRGEAGWPGTALTLAALPLSGLYWVGQAVRSGVYGVGLIKARPPALPVISVGNLVVGGTGKTPVASWVARRLLEAGVRPAVLLRGYGKDEVLLHRRWNPDALVVVGGDRVRSAGEAARGGAGAAVLDDGFQHRRIQRDLDLVLVAAEHPFPGRLLPAGPFREPVSALKRADMVVLTRRTADDETVERRLDQIEDVAPGKAGTVLRLVPGPWTDLQGAAAQLPSGPLLAVTAVAGPGLFAEIVRNLTNRPVSLMAFPDHHDFDQVDLRRIATEASGRVVVTTEKDAVKLAPLGTLPATARVLPLSVQPERGGTALQQALSRIVASVSPDVPTVEAESGGDTARGPTRGSGEGGSR